MAGTCLRFWLIEPGKLYQQMGRFPAIAGKSPCESRKVRWANIAMLIAGNVPSYCREHKQACKCFNPSLVCRYSVLIQCWLLYTRWLKVSGVPNSACRTRACSCSADLGSAAYFSRNWPWGSKKPEVILARPF